MEKDIKNIKHDIRMLTETILSLNSTVKDAMDGLINLNRVLTEIDIDGIPAIYDGMETIVRLDGEVIKYAKSKERDNGIIGECEGPDVYISGTPGDYKNPIWPELINKEVHEWKNHIGPDVQPIWNTFTDVQKAILAIDAQGSADGEEWE